MKLTMRKYQTEDDYWRIRAFLREVFLLNDRRELGWQAARLDYWRWRADIRTQPLEDVIFIWETAAGKIVAVLNPEASFEAFLQVHPGFRTPELEDEMLAVAEERLFMTGAKDGLKRLWVWAHDHDTLRTELLTRRGFIKRDAPGYPMCDRRRLLDEPVPDGPVPAGYTVRAIGDVDSGDWESRSWASWRAFHPDEPDEDYDGWAWSVVFQQMPLYRRDLDLVAVAPAGEIAAYCILWYDDVTRTGYFEPVAVLPEHQRRGLGKAIMCEAMRRLKRMGGVMASVGGGTAAANALYGSLMPGDCDVFTPWEKTWA